MFQLMAVEGVMARHVADVRAGLLAVAGAHVRDPLALPVELAEPAPGAAPPGRRRRRAAGLATDPGIAAAIRATADALAEAGHVVEEVVADELRAHRRAVGRAADDATCAPCDRCSTR